MKNLIILIFASICFTTLSYSSNNETLNRPPDCGITDEYFECVFEGDIEIILNDIDTTNINALEVCTETCDSNPFVTVTSDYDIDNFIYFCANSGFIDIEYTLTDDCGIEESIFVYISFEDTSILDLSSCNVTDTTFNLPCTDPDIITILDDWNQANINELEFCPIDDCGFGGAFVYSDYDISFICIDNSLTVTYEVSDDCGNFSAVTVTAFLDGYSESYVTGNNILDVNSDGCDVVTDPIFPNLRFNIDGDSRTYYSNTSGSYTLGLQDGMHVITPQVANPDYFTVTPSSVSVDFPTDPSPYSQDFCVTANGTHNDLEIYLWSSPAVPGFENYAHIYYRNVGNTTLSGNIEFNYNDDVMDLLNANPTEATASTGNLTFNYTNLEPFQARTIIIYMQLNTPTDPTFPLNAGDILAYDTTINPVSGDETPANNTKNHNRIVTNSFDPNDVTCLEGQEIEVSEVGKDVHYRIRFENNGTANATHVRVRDVIDLAKFDISTLIPVAGSHSYVTDIKNGNEVDFIFENINLPFDDANNDGYVVFKIKTLESLIVGDTFSNQAAIYFDFNPAVNTNIETTTIIENQLSVDDFESTNQITIYPNPIENELFIESQSLVSQVIIYNVTGKIIKSIATESSSFQNKIDVSNLSAGLYFIKVTSGNRTNIEKVIKI